MKYTFRKMKTWKEEKKFYEKICLLFHCIPPPQCHVGVLKVFTIFDRHIGLQKLRSWVVQGHSMQLRSCILLYCNGSRSSSLHLCRSYPCIHDRHRRQFHRLQRTVWCNALAILYQSWFVAQLSCIWYVWDHIGGRCVWNCQTNRHSLADGRNCIQSILFHNRILYRWQRPGKQ